MMPFQRMHTAAARLRRRADLQTRSQPRSQRSVCEDLAGNSAATPRRQHARRGATTIIALLVLLILAGMLAQYVRRVISDRRQFRQELLHWQAEKLAEAGLELAIAAREDDPAREGWTWSLPAGSIHQTNSAEVLIEIQDDECTAIARYPANSDIPFQVTRTRKLTP